jgi:hypothetical protein
VRHVERIRKVRNAYISVVRKPEAKKPLGRSRRKWEDNIKMHRMHIGLEDVDWIYLAQDGDLWWALVNTVMNIRCSINDGELPD